MPIQVGAESDTQYASKRQIAFLFELARERDADEEIRKRLVHYLERHQDSDDSYLMTKDRASKWIKWMLKAPVRPGVVPDRIRAMPKAETPEKKSKVVSIQRPKRDLEKDPLPTSGVFQFEGTIYIVVPSKRNPGKFYAKKMIETPPRLTTSGETVTFDYVAAPGMIWFLYESNRLPEQAIRKLMVKHSVCIYPGCYRSLRAAKSVAAGVGKRHAEKLGIPWGRKSLCRS